MGTQHVLAHQAVAQAQLHQTQQPSLADTVSAATAAITTDPNFTAALAVAISSIIGEAQANNNNAAATNNNNGSPSMATSNTNNNKISNFHGN
ncbi:hypothetical protein CJ030_MR0G027763 [Morella rubra]|uniref:Uncharacterized protein n=1 Tax=Morella rubra TaxID=262757 RepID=A0A6A1UFD0_9ROSI|nr:hypothetical protein CJ030_MR0G027781 [Morella rubra]KAB1199087.1 hypothetical protein CJ030_MR0G027763 [Morella rubra]